MTPSRNRLVAELVSICHLSIVHSQNFAANTSIACKFSVYLFGLKQLKFIFPSLYSTLFKDVFSLDRQSYVGTLPVKCRKPLVSVLQLNPDPPYVLQDGLKDSCPCRHLTTFPQNVFMLYCIHIQKLSCLRSGVKFDTNDIFYEFKYLHHF